MCACRAAGRGDSESCANGSGPTFAGRMRLTWLPRRVKSTVGPMLAPILARTLVQWLSCGNHQIREMFGNGFRLGSARVGLSSAKLGSALARVEGSFRIILSCFRPDQCWFRQALLAPDQRQVWPGPTLRFGVRPSVSWGWCRPNLCHVDQF